MAGEKLEFAIRRNGSFLVHTRSSSAQDAWNATRCTYGNAGARYVEEMEQAGFECVCGVFSESGKKHELLCHGFYPEKITHLANIVSTPNPDQRYHTGKCGTDSILVKGT